MGCKKKNKKKNFKNPKVLCTKNKENMLLLWAISTYISDVKSLIFLQAFFREINFTKFFFVKLKCQVIWPKMKSVHNNFIIRKKNVRMIFIKEIVICVKNLQHKPKRCI